MLVPLFPFLIVCLSLLAIGLLLGYQFRLRHTATTHHRVFLKGIQAERARFMEIYRRMN